MSIDAITESELESALAERFALLLPDLHKDGYRLTRQVQLVGISRRIDIVLKMPDCSSAWIIELKRASPNVADTTAQILDYQRCWEAAYPNIPVKLMVISTGASDEKIAALKKNNIQYRAIPTTKIKEVLSNGISQELLGYCNRMTTNDVQWIRKSLSNIEHTTVPESMRFGRPWSHKSVYYALIRDKHELKSAWLKNIYVKLIRGAPNCVVLYHPEAARKDDAPLHVNERARSWPTDGWLLDKLRSCNTIKHVSRDNKGPGRERHEFDHYKVLDWDQFATALELEA